MLIKNMLEDMGVEGSPDEAIPINNVSKARSDGLVTNHSLLHEHYLNITNLTPYS